MNFNRMLAAIFAASAINMPAARLTAPMARKCLLKDYQVMTTHNGGFCCAEHHKKYFELMKKRFG